MPAAQNMPISGLPAYTTYASNDLSVVVDTSDTTYAATGTDKQVTLGALAQAMGSPGFFNVMAYGATGNGVTNDTAAISAAIAAAKAAGNGVVWFPTGTYLVSGGTFYLSSNLTLIGSGKFCSTLKLVASSGDMFTLAASGNVSNFEMRDLNLVAPALGGNLITVGAIRQCRAVVSSEWRSPKKTALLMRSMALPWPVAPITGSRSLK